MFRLLQRCILIFLVVYCNAGLAKSDHALETIKEMESIRSEFRLPSLSLAILSENKIVFADAIGFSNVRNLDPATTKTQYSVGSIAKPMTGLALAKLVDLKKVDMKASVSTYVSTPYYTANFSVEELASHIAGVPHDTPERNLAEFENIKNHASPFDAFYVFDKHPLLFSAGSQYKYSSNGYILLSAVVEKAADTGYVDFLSTSLWQTFDMSSTEFDTSFAGLKTEATYYVDYDDNNNYIESSTKRDRSFLFGAGGFISTPTDLVKMAKATFEDSFLSQTTRNLLLKPITLRNGEVNSENYSIGWRVGQLQLNSVGDQTLTVLHHGGVTDGASTAYLMVVPKCRAAVAFATNYVPEKFWKIRGRMASILTGYLNRSNC